MLEKVKWRHLPVFFLFSLLVCPTVFGLFRKADGPLVENAKAGMVYLFQFPRTSTCPSQAALNLKTETFLKWEKIPFHRLSNQFLLGSQTDGTAPYAYYKEENGTEHWIDGSDAIIDFVANTIKKDVKRETLDEKKLRNAIDNILFKILMLDRATRNKETDVGGLDWMLRDEGIITQIMPALVPDRAQNAFKIDTVQYQIRLNYKAWKAYFDLYDFHDLQAKIFSKERLLDSSAEPREREKVTFLYEHSEVNGKKVDKKDMALTMEQWKLANDEIHALINTALRTTFKALLQGKDGQMQPNPKSSEAKLDVLLEHNFIDEDKKRTYNSLYGKGDEILKIVENELKPFLDYKTNKILNFFNPKRFQTPTGASLFGVLVQFFETPLNIPELRDYFQPEKGKKLSKDVKKLKKFVNNVKKSLKINDNKWSELKRKPWTLNYENPTSADKYTGPFSVKTGDLDDIFDSWGNLKEIREQKNAVEAAVEKIINYVDVKHSESVTIAKLKMVRLMAAYLCNLGAEKNRKLETECAKKHKEKADEFKTSTSASSDFSLIKKLTYDTIVEYNEELVRTKVMEAVGKAQKIAASPDQTIAASASSLANIGNEL